MNKADYLERGSLLPLFVMVALLSGEKANFVLIGNVPVTSHAARSAAAAGCESPGGSRCTQSREMPGLGTREE